MKSILSYTLGISLALAGCADITGDDDTDGGGGGGKADQINPMDSENLGKLTVTQPAMPGQPNPYTYKLSYRNSPIELNQEYRLTRGDGTLALINSMYGSGGMVKQRELVTGVNTEKLAGFTVRWDNTPSSTVAVDFGQIAQVAATWMRPNTTPQKLIDGTTGAASNLNGAESQPFVVFGGDYTIGFGARVLGEQPVTLADGQFKRLDLTPPDRRAVLRVHAPSRVQPNIPKASTCEPTERVFLVQRKYAVGFSTVAEPAPNSQGMVRVKSYSLATDESVRMLPFVPGDTDHYELVVNNQPIEVALTPNQTTDIYVKRIDVNDVLVTREDGTTYMQPGRYRVFKQNPNGAWQELYLLTYGCPNLAASPNRTNFPTKTGLDVLPGVYKVLISYNTAEGPKTQEHILNLN